MLSLISSSAAFMPAAAGLRATAPTQPRLAVSPNMMSELDLAGSVIRGVAVLPTMYALMSLNEYMTHRYFQHLEFNRKESLPLIKQFWRAVSGAEEDPKFKGDGHVEHRALSHIRHRPVYISARGLSTGHNATSQSVYRLSV